MLGGKDAHSPAGVLCPSDADEAVVRLRVRFPAAPAISDSWSQNILRRFCVSKCRLVYLRTLLIRRGNTLARLAVGNPGQPDHYVIFGPLRWRQIVQESPLPGRCRDRLPQAPIEDFASDV